MIVLKVSILYFENTCDNLKIIHLSIITFDLLYLISVKLGLYSFVFVSNMCTRTYIQRNGNDNTNNTNNIL